MKKKKMRQTDREKEKAKDTNSQTDKKEERVTTTQISLHTY